MLIVTLHVLHNYSYIHGGGACYEYFLMSSYVCLFHHGSWVSMVYVFDEYTYGYKI
jgi:hypothetical protein